MNTFDGKLAEFVTDNRLGENHLVPGATICYVPASRSSTFRHASVIVSVNPADRTVVVKGDAGVLETKSYFQLGIGGAPPDYAYVIITDGSALEHLDELCGPRASLPASRRRFSELTSRHLAG